MGSSKIDVDAILSYVAIHENLIYELKKDIAVTEDKMRNSLKKINVLLNYKIFVKLSNIKTSTLPT